MGTFYSLSCKQEHTNLLSQGNRKKRQNTSNRQNSVKNSKLNWICQCLVRYLSISKCRVINFIEIWMQKSKQTPNSLRIIISILYIFKVDNLVFTKKLLKKMFSLFC